MASLFFGAPLPQNPGNSPGGGTRGSGATLTEQEKAVLSTFADTVTECLSPKGVAQQHQSPFPSPAPSASTPIAHLLSWEEGQSNTGATAMDSQVAPWTTAAATATTTARGSWIMWSKGFKKISLSGIQQAIQAAEFLPLVITTVLFHVVRSTVPSLVRANAPCETYIEWRLDFPGRSRGQQLSPSSKWDWKRLDPGWSRVSGAEARAGGAHEREPAENPPSGEASRPRSNPTGASRFTANLNKHDHVVEDMFLRDIDSRDRFVAETLIAVLSDVVGFRQTARIRSQFQVVQWSTPESRSKLQPPPKPSPRPRPKSKTQTQLQLQPQPQIPSRPDSPFSLYSRGPGKSFRDQLHQNPRPRDTWGSGGGIHYSHETTTACIPMSRAEARLHAGVIRPRPRSGNPGSTAQRSPKRNSRRVIQPSGAGSEWENGWTSGSSGGDSSGNWSSGFVSSSSNSSSSSDSGGGGDGGDGGDRWGKNGRGRGGLWAAPTKERFMTDGLDFAVPASTSSEQNQGEVSRHPEIMRICTLNIRQVSLRDLHRLISTAPSLIDEIWFECGSGMLCTEWHARAFGGDGFWARSRPKQGAHEPVRDGGDWGGIAANLSEMLEGKVPCIELSPHANIVMRTAVGD